MQNPLAFLDHFSRKYPGIWKRLVEIHFMKGRGLPDWPDWCFIPMAGAYAVISGGGSNRVPPEQIQDVAAVTALSAWRLSQGIYRFDETVYRELLKTSLDGDLPVEILYRLPEWCLYIETPGMGWDGFFIHLEWDANSGRTELRFVFLADEGFFIFPLHIEAGSLYDAVKAAAHESTVQQALFSGSPHTLVPNEIIREIEQKIRPCLALVIYLCSSTAEYKGPSPKPNKIKPKKTKKGLKLFPPPKPVIWKIGESVGAEIRQTSERGNVQARTSPRPHIRRAHWHHYWTGPRKSDDRKLVVKWIPPLLIGT